MENENNGYEVMQVSHDNSIIQMDPVERANVHLHALQGPSE